MTQSELEKAATWLLRKNGYTWAGNPKSKELSERRKEEVYIKVSNGMSKTGNGIICKRRKG